MAILCFWKAEDVKRVGVQAPTRTPAGQNGKMIRRDGSERRALEMNRRQQITAIETALSDMREARSTHQEWADYYRAYPDEADVLVPRVQSTNDIPGNLEWCGKYDRVIELLDILLAEEKYAAHRLLNRFFNLEVINGRVRCPTYLYRWELFRLRKRAIYLHHFVGDDWSRDLHDHPKRFISIGVKGRYIEETPRGERVYRAPWIRTFPATHIHRLRMINKADCWTIVIVLKTVREWGFWHGSQWIQWYEYVFGKESEAADETKSC